MKNQNGLYNLVFYSGARAANTYYSDTIHDLSLRHFLFHCYILHGATGSRAKVYLQSYNFGYNKWHDIQEFDWTDEYSKQVFDTISYSGVLGIWRIKTVVTGATNSAFRCFVSCYAGT